MGGTSEEDQSRKQNQQHWRPASTLKLKALLLLAATNVLTALLASLPSPGRWSEYSGRGALLCQELNSTRLLLRQSHAEAADLSIRLATSSALLETLVVQLGRSRTGEASSQSAEEQGGWKDELFGELELAVGPHKFPQLGRRSPNTGLAAELHLHPPVGAGCRHFQEELVEYMTYEVGGECPQDGVFAQRLMLKGCDPLPRRRCRPKSPAGYAEPRPLPESLWATPPDTSITWDAYTCKSYDCLARRGRAGGDPRSYDCKDCFDLLGGRENTRWLADTDGLDYGIDAVLATRPPGTVRIGLDLGGGTGTFAARMRERGVTVVTTTMDFDGPFNSFIAARGLVPMHLSVSHRLPFYDGTLDVVHSMHVLSNWVPAAVLELTLYDVYRVLRPGGLFWLDHFFCVGGQLDETYVPMIDGVGFRRLRWNAGRKTDRGEEMNEWYLSALLEKPMT